jgi:hypothetical protein
MSRKPARKTKKARTSKTPKSSPRRAAAVKSAKARAKAPRKKAAPRPKGQPDAIDAMIASSAQALRLPIDPAWHGGVKFNLQLIIRLSAVFDDFPLPDDAEPGPVFHA